MKVTGHSAILMMFAAVTITVNILYGFVQSDETRHSDLYNYYQGFKSINEKDFFTFTNHYGRPSEILLPVIHYLIHKTGAITSATDLLKAHVMIFWPFLVVSYVIFVTKITPDLGTNHKLNMLMWLLAMAPVGWPLQLSRQAFSFIFILLFLPIVIRKFRMLSTLSILAPISHIANIFLLPMIIMKSRPYLTLVFLAIISILSFIIAKLYSIPEAGLGRLFLNVIQPFQDTYSNIIIGTLLVILLVRATFYQKLTHIAPIFLMVIISYSKIFFVDRFLFAAVPFFIAMSIYLIYRDVRLLRIGIINIFGLFAVLLTCWKVVYITYLVNI